ncbi:TIGR03085 family metal-binding protein [Streptomyces sp. NPDC020983]|uniref:TIGR03085 family metal-binding protein n=1 Tax=Streptomyces sp. NPDC020983 TaxID=3365106 RepID=UPI0037970C4A
MTTHAQRERLLLADLLEASGPDAPTLCGNWTTRDLAAHVVVRERRGDAAAGLVVPRLADRLERVRREYAERPYAELIRLIRTGPPRLSPFALKQLDEASNTVEFYVHTEDVRRAQPQWTPREIDPVFADALWKRLERAARLFGRRSPVGLVLRRPDGQTVVAHRGSPVVTVTGEPAELTMYAFGRQAVADVRAEGEAEAVGRAAVAELGV